MKSASPSVSEPDGRRHFWRSATRKASWLHRWLGVAFCLLFALWFATGAVMIYVPFPSLSEGDRIASAEPLPLSTPGLTPEEALSALGDAQVERLRLVGVLGSTRYLAELADGSVAVISDRPAASPWLDAGQAAQVAGRFAGKAFIGDIGVAGVAGPFAYDQWTVHQRFDAVRPFFRASLGDEDGTELYVSARTGEVLQRTTAFARGWNWVGAVAHWIYPTVLRKSFSAWDRTVWWLSLAGMAMALLGFGLGIVRTLDRRHAQGRGISPFRGWMRWHHVLGLTAGILLLTWIFSGWLSMDHGRLFSTDRPATGDPQALRGIRLQDAVRGVTTAQLAALGDVREIEFVALGGQAFAVLRGGMSSNGRVQGSVVVPVDRLADPAARSTELPDGLLLAAARRAWGAANVLGIERIASDDAYVQLRNDSLPPSARRIVLSDSSRTWVHIDAASGRILSVMDRSRRLYRWLYAGLHTFDFPLLNRAGPLWQVLMLAALASGFALSITGMVLAARRVCRDLAPS